MKTFLKIIFILFLLQLSACTPDNFSLDEKIPNGAIVYTPKRARGKIVGFFEEGDSKPSLIWVKSYLSKFTWVESARGFMAFSWHQPVGGSAFVFWGPDKNTKTNLVNMCDQNFSLVAFNENEVSAYIQNYSKIAFIVFKDFSSPEKTETVIPYAKEMMAQMSFSYSGISYNPIDGCLYAGVVKDRLHYSATDQIMKYCPETGSWEDVTFGMEPEVSPDSRFLAFTRDTGLYLLDLNTFEEKRILHADFSFHHGLLPSHPKWRLDGEKIVIHVWDSSDDSEKPIPKIVIIDVSSGEYTDTGMMGTYPSFKGIKQ